MQYSQGLIKGSFDEDIFIDFSKFFVLLTISFF